MKKLIAIILPLFVFIFACKNVEQFRKPIESLSADWEKATTSFTDAGTLLASVQGSIAGLKDSLVVDPKMKLDANKLKLVDSLKSSFMGNFAGLTEMANKLTSMSANWQDGTTKLAALKEGLTSGKLDATTLTQIESLKSMLSETNSTTQAVTEAANASKTSAMSIYEAFKAAIAKK
ncbi:MAG: hypothetical protein WBB26_07960 [Saprospiraceae bacterium]|nr:hypothetical protein [Saprospiraceae bacterium]